MPTYEYRCAKCGNHFEIYQSFSEEPLKKHPACGGKVTKVLSAAGIVLKGSGFYKNDSSDSARSRSKQRSEPAAASSGKSGSDGSKSESTNSDSAKSESTKPDSTTSDSTRSSRSPSTSSSEQKSA